VLGKRLGEALLNAGVVTKEQLAEAVRVQGRRRGMLGEILVSLGHIDEEQLADALAEQLGYERGLPELGVAKSDVAGMLGPDFPHRYRVIPLARRGDEIIVGTPDPTDVAALDAARRALRTSKLRVSVLTSREFEVALATQRGLQEAIAELPKYGSGDGPAELALADTEDALLALKRPAVRLVDELLRRAVSLRATDIHIEPQDDRSLVRMRVDGVLQNVATLPKQAHQMIISRIKVLSELDIAKRHIPQDGHHRIRAEHGKVDLRISVLPVVGGEKVVIRLLNPEESNPSLADLGLSDATLARFRQLLDRPQGMLIATGPTGSGKTTTLYAALAYVRRRIVNITTIEDPVERNIDGLNQVHVHPKQGLTFASGLRAILRQDPDVIMIGEMRDLETAETAFRAALTGHLAATTLHTNDAASAITRLEDMRLPPYLVASSLIGVLSQRLARVVCDHCGQWRNIPERERRRLMRLVPNGAIPERERWGRGCRKCGETGYHGRTAVAELLEVGDEISALITRPAGQHEIREAAVAAGMQTIQEAGLAQVAEGRTTAAEILRAVPPASEVRRTEAVALVA